MRFTINYTHYENPDLFKRVSDYYEPYKDLFDFTVIDDGSQEHPLSRDIVPSWWKLYRIEKDYGWGNEICRNILMKKTRTNWNILLDLDYVVNLKSDIAADSLLVDFPKWYGHLVNLPIAFQFEKIRSDFTEHLNRINCFIISKTCWNEHTYGYDMSFGWTCGYDFTLFAQLLDEPALPGSMLTHIAEKASPNSSKRLFKSYTDRRTKFIEAGHYKGSKWLDEKERIKHCIPMPEVVEC